MSNATLAVIARAQALAAPQAKVKAALGALAAALDGGKKDEIDAAAQAANAAIDAVTPQPKA